MYFVRKKLSNYLSRYPYFSKIYFCWIILVSTVFCHFCRLFLLTFRILKLWILRPPSVFRLRIFHCGSARGECQRSRFESQILTRDCFRFTSVFLHIVYLLSFILLSTATFCIQPVLAEKPNNQTTKNRSTVFQTHVR